MPCEETRQPAPIEMITDDHVHRCTVEQHVLIDVPDVEPLHVCGCGAVWPVDP